MKNYFNMNNQQNDPDDDWEKEQEEKEQREIEEAKERYFTSDWHPMSSDKGPGETDEDYEERMEDLGYGPNC